MVERNRPAAGDQVNPVKALRIAAGLSQDEVAERVGVLQGAISKIEMGHRLPSLRCSPTSSMRSCSPMLSRRAGSCSDGRERVAEAESGITVLVAIADVMQLTMLSPVRWLARSCKTATSKSATRRRRGLKIAPKRHT